MAWRLVPAATLVMARWRNGLGTSREIAGEAGADGLPLWQVSIADLEQDADFSDYPNCDRVFTPIAGAPPPELAFHDGPFERCELLVPRRFPGDVPTRSRIPAPGRAFNAIADRRRYRIMVTPLHLAATARFAVPEAAHVVVHCLAGRLAVGGFALGAGDSVVGASGGDGTAAEGSVVLTVAFAG